MTAKFDIPQELHRVNALPPIDINGVAAAARSTDYFHLKSAGVAYFEVALGVTGAASTITVEEASDNAGTGNTAIAFDYRAEETAAGDTYGNWTAATSAGFATSTEDSIMYSIRIAVESLTKGKPYVQLIMSDPSAATLVSVQAYLGDIDFQQNVTKTVLT